MKAQKTVNVTGDVEAGADVTSGVHNLTSLLATLRARIDSDEANGAGNGSLSLREILELVGTRAYGPILLLIGVLAVSPAGLIPGFNWALATLALLVAIQLAAHTHTPWLPTRILDVSIPQQTLKSVVLASAPVARIVDRIVRPRFQFLAQPPWTIATALMCAMAALVTYPLGMFPLAPFLPSLAIALLGLGLTTRDGVLLGLGTLVMAGAIWFLVSGFRALF